MEPKGAKMSPRGAQKHQKDAKEYPKSSKLEAQGTTMEPQGHPKYYKDATSPSKCHYNTKICPKVPKNKQAHTDKNNQPTK